MTKGIITLGIVTFLMLGAASVEVKASPFFGYSEVVDTSDTQYRNRKKVRKKHSRRNPIPCRTRRGCKRY